MMPYLDTCVCVVGIGRCFRVLATLQKQYMLDVYQSLILFHTLPPLRQTKHVYIQFYTSRHIASKIKEEKSGIHVHLTCCSRPCLANLFFFSPSMVMYLSSPSMYQTYTLSRPYPYPKHLSVGHT